VFGMEKQQQKKKEKPKLFEFDIEKELKDSSKSKEYATRIQQRVTKIKELLRKGSRKEDFDSLGILLNGYHALAITLGRSAKGTSK